MSYMMLGQNLHETADRAKKYFAQTYGAAHFECEKALDKDLPLKPTWQGTMNAGYRLCVEVRESPFSNSLYEFVVECSKRRMPIRLWVAVPHGNVGPTFNSELKQARDLGVGIVQIAEDGTGNEFHKPVALSLFGLKRTDLNAAPKPRREFLKNAEDLFLTGSPDKGCQEICQCLELVTRQFAEHTYGAGLWRTPEGANTLAARFFREVAWATMLEALDTRIDEKRTRAKCKAFKKAKVAGARHYTDWRNTLSHKPKTLKEFQDRDAKLRTMFEATRDLLIEWYDIVKPLKLAV